MNGRSCISEQKGNERTFDFLNKLGQGTFGKVYKIFDSGSFHAVKQITNEEKNEGICISAVRELTFLNRLRNHPMILNYESIDIKRNGTVNIVFPLMSCDLYDWIPHKSISDRFEMMKLLAYRMIIVLRDMDELGIIHRDIKPQNILLDNKDVPYLCDFGSGREYLGFNSPHLKQTNYKTSFAEFHTVNMITYLYRPPEIIKSNYYTTKVDIYSLGCTLIQVLVGRPVEFDRVPHPSDWSIHLTKFLEENPNFEIEIIWIRMLKSMICANPDIRLSAKSVLNLAFYEKVNNDVQFRFKLTPSQPLNIIKHPLTETILKELMQANGIGLISSRVHHVYTRCLANTNLCLNSKLILSVSCIALVLKLMDQDYPPLSDIIKVVTPHTKEIILKSDILYGECYVMKLLQYHLF
jgi:serine/threonine protein kinase